MSNDFLRAARDAACGEIEVTIVDADTAASLGSGDLPILGTPRVVALMELAAVTAIAGRLDGHLTTVGVHIDVRHFVPTAVGERVRTEAHVTDVNGRRIEFRLMAMCRGEEIARGRHLRVLVDRREFLSRLHPL